MQRKLGWKGEIDKSSLIRYLVIERE